MESAIKEGNGEKYLHILNEKIQQAKRNDIAIESYERLAHKIENQMSILKEKEENRISVGNTLINSLLTIRQTTSDLAQAIETEDISETLASFSEEINKLITGIVFVGEQINKTQDLYNRFWENFREWRV